MRSLALLIFVAGVLANDDLSTVRSRRLSFITRNLDASDAPSWLSSLSANGTWPDVDYATGCSAQRANWPAQTHWNRIRLSNSTPFTNYLLVQSHLLGRILAALPNRVLP